MMLSSCGTNVGDGDGESIDEEVLELPRWEIGTRTDVLLRYSVGSAFLGEGTTLEPLIRASS